MAEDRSKSRLGGANRPGWARNLPQNRELPKVQLAAPFLHGFVLKFSFLRGSQIITPYHWIRRGFLVN